MGLLTFLALLLNGIVVVVALFLLDIKSLEEAMEVEMFEVIWT